MPSPPSCYLSDALKTLDLSLEIFLLGSWGCNHELKHFMYKNIFYIIIYSGENKSLSYYEKVKN